MSCVFISCQFIKRLAVQRSGHEDINISTNELFKCNSVVSNKPRIDFICQISEFIIKQCCIALVSLTAKHVHTILRSVLMLMLFLLASAWFYVSSNSSYHLQFLTLII